MRMVDLRRLIWSRLAAEAEALPGSGNAVADLPERLQHEPHIVARLDQAAREVAQSIRRRSVPGHLVPKKAKR